MRCWRRVASDSEERSGPRSANQTFMAALPQEMTEPASAWRYSSLTPEPNLVRAASMICSVQWSQASSSERASERLSWVRLNNSAMGATDIGSARAISAACADSRMDSSAGRSRNCSNAWSMKPSATEARAASRVGK
ncbi:hypothetical protein PJL18_03388 [Paenarthrobacter nicotinovorans]|nr:hypothetical protein [Paenarthrobacter nicotinovorans]